jgi:hypothetical protein
MALPLATLFNTATFEMFKLRPTAVVDLKNPTGPGHPQKSSGVLFPSPEHDEAIQAHLFWLFSACGEGIKFEKVANKLTN